MRIFKIVADHWLAITLCLLAVVTFVSLRPLHIVLPPNSDKTMHFIVYAIVALPVALASPRNLIGVLFGIAVWSGVIELIQPYVGRYGEWMDLFANIGGIAIGAMLGLAVMRFIAAK